MLKRTSRCAELTLKEVGTEQVLCGWVNRRRNLGNLLFVTLRDISGIMQLVFDDTTDAQVFERASQLRSEFVIAAKGILQARTPDMVNPNMATGELELKVTELEILSKAQTPPF